MSFEPVMSLSKAAREAGVSRWTLKRWLAADLAIVLPQRLPRGSKRFVRVADVEYVIRKRTARSDWSLLRRAS